MVVEVLIIAVCLVLNGLLAAVEMAFVSIGKPLLRQLARGGDKEAQKILFLREAPERTLSVIQIGITLVASISAAVGGAGAYESISPIFQRSFGLKAPIADIAAMAAVVVPLTYLNVLLGELVPKTLALRRPLWIMLKATRWLIAIEKILDPFVSGLEWSTRRILALGKFKHEHTEPVIGDTIELSGLSSQTRQYVINLVSIEHKRVCDILVPWGQVIYVRHDQSMMEVESIILHSGHTRLPVMLNGTVIGIINTKEFMALRASGQENWGTLIRPALRVQESDTLFRAFRAMQEIRSHLSIVYHGNRLSGIVTMEDILEEFIGEIYDEDDDSRLRKILLAGRMSRYQNAR